MKSSEAPHHPAIFSGPSAGGCFESGSSAGGGAVEPFRERPEGGVSAHHQAAVFAEKPTSLLPQTNRRTPGLPPGEQTPQKWSFVFSCNHNSEGVFNVQLLDEESGKVGELWTSVDTSYQRLERTVDGGTAQLLQGQMEEELKRSEAYIKLSLH